MSNSGGVTPYIAVNGARAAIDFYVNVFGAKEIYALEDPADGRIGHAEIQFGDGIMMLSDEYPDFGAVGPEALGGSPVKLHLYVEDVDTIFAKALKAGATEVRPVKDQFFGDRSGVLVDPFGHTWMIATQTKEVSPDEMQRLWNEGMAG